MRPGGERIKSPLYMLALRRMNWSAEHRQEADHMAPLTGIHAYFINNKPIYSTFLADVKAQGGSTDLFSPPSAFPDGYFAAIPWVGVVVQKNPDYEGDTAAYKAVSITLNGQIYLLRLNSTQSFETGVTGYFHSAPAPQREDYFGVPPLTGTEEVTVTLLYDDVPYQNTVLAPVEPLGATTKWSDIILNYGNLFTDDVRNQEAYDINPAAFLNTASYYLQAAIPRFNRPTEIISYLSQRTPSFSRRHSGLCRLKSCHLEKCRHLLQSLSPSRPSLDTNCVLWLSGAQINLEIPWTLPIPWKPTTLRRGR